MGDFFNTQELRQVQEQAFGAAVPVQAVETTHPDNADAGDQADGAVYESGTVRVKPYTLRKLCAKDIFPFAKILSKVGIKQFQECFTVDENDNLTLAMNGLAVALNVIDILLANLDRCENEIYAFLAGVSGMATEEIMNMDMDFFAEMIIDIFQKREFSDFFKAVSRVLGLEY